MFVLNAALAPAEFVVGGAQDRRIFFQIDTHQQPAAVELQRGTAQEGQPLVVGHVADRAAGKEAQPLMRRLRQLGQRKAAQEIGADGIDLQRRKIRGHIDRMGQQMLGGNVDRDVDSRVAQPRQQDAGLGHGAAAVIHQRAAEAGQPGNFIGMLPQQRHLHPRHVVLGPVEDRVEQL